MKVLGLVCMRKGSKRLKDKNIKKIEGKPLYMYAIDALNGAENIHKTYLATDYEKIKYKNVIKRPESLNTPDVPLQNVIGWVFQKLKDEKYDAVCHVMATNPLINSYDIDGAIHDMVEYNFDIVRSYDFFGRENGLILAKGKVFTSESEVFTNINLYFDVHTGSITTNGEEIHTQKDYLYIRKLMKEA